MPGLQRQFEREIHAQIDDANPETCQQFAEHAYTWLDPELMQNFLAALITGDADQHAAATAAIKSHIDKHRAEFMEFEAQRRVKALEDSRAGDPSDSMHGMVIRGMCNGG